MTEKVLLASDVFISYAHADADWVRQLAIRLEDAGLRVYFDEWDLELSTVAVHELDEAIRCAPNAIQVLSPRSVDRPWVREEYAALLNQSVWRGLRFIPIIYGDVDIPPFAANRVALDFRHVDTETYELRVAELVRTLRGEPRLRGTAASQGVVGAAFSGRDRPLDEPDPHAVVVCYAPVDVDYGELFAEELRRGGLPVWTLADLQPGDDPIWTVRRQLRWAVAVAVVMSPDAQDSADISRMILEAGRHSRPFFPILLGPARHYQLADSWYFDARGGRLPGTGELALLRSLREADRRGDEPRVARLMPTAPQRPQVPAIGIPTAVALRRLREHLDQREFEHADLLTTSMLLDAASRLDSGWIEPDSEAASRLRPGVLAGVDELWMHYSDGRYGFVVQAAECLMPGVRHADFLPLSVRLGWRAHEADPVPRYAEFARLAAGREGFFPTLRHPPAEQYPNWYDQWWQTVVAVHRQLTRARNP